MSKIMETMGYVDSYTPTGVVAKCVGEGRHNGEVGEIYNYNGKLYIKFDKRGIYSKCENLAEMGYEFITYQPWAQEALTF